jgi:hypothetical protein
MESAVDYLTAAITQLETQRNDLDRQITVLRRSLAELSQLSGTPVRHVRSVSDHVGVHDGARATVTRGAARPIRDIAFDVARSHDLFSLDDVLKAAQAEGNDSQYASVSSMLSRMRVAGELVRGPRRGTYRLAPEKSEAPSNEGASDAPTSLSAAGTADPDPEEVTHDDRDRVDHHAPVTG